MLFRKIMFCVLLVLPVFLDAQKNKADSLTSLVANTKNDTVKIIAETDLGRLFWHNHEFDSARAWETKSIADCDQLLRKIPARDTSYKNIVLTKKAKAYLGIAYTYADEEKYILAEKNFTTAKDLYALTGDKKSEASMYNNKGTVNQLMGNYPEALKNYFASLKLKEEIHDKRAQGISYCNIGAVYGLMENYTDALSAFKSAQSLSTEAKDDDGIGDAYQGLGNVYAYLHDTAASLSAYAQAEKYYTNTNNLSNLGKVYVNVSDIFIARHQEDTGLFCLQKALHVFEEAEDPQNISMTSTDLGILYTKLGEYGPAQEFLHRAFNLSQEIGDKEGCKASSKALSELYSLEKDYQNAYKYSQLYTAYKDSLFSEDKNREIGKLQQKSENDKENAIKDAEHKKEIEKTQAVASAESDRLSAIIAATVIGLALVIIFSVFLFNRFRVTQKQKQIIELKNRETEMQKELIEEKQKEIIDSINYAKKIQDALLAHEHLLAENLSDHFLFFRPKDIVSGDFYWATTLGNRFYLAVCDSTGHGVPGAFMSLLNISYLNEALIEKNILQPDKILNHVRKRLIENVSQDSSERSMQDGMDAILICYDKTYGKISYAAAHNAPVFVRAGELSTLQADKMPVGKGERTYPFTLYTIDVQKNDCIYLYTDGFADQFGGPKGKKFKYKQLNELLLQHTGSPMKNQEKILSGALDSWKNNLEQVDDICVIGFRI